MSSALSRIAGTSEEISLEADALPEDWPLVPLGSLCCFANGVNAEKEAYGKGVRFINVLEVITCSHLSATDIPGRVVLPKAALEAFAVRRGDVLFNRTSETQDEVGLSAVYDDDEKVVFGGFVIRGRFVSDAFDPTYVGYAFRAPIIRSQIVSQGQGAIRSNIGQANLKRLMVPIPPRPEQRAIAEALSDVDGLLGALEALIAKKRAIKQAAMQQLLTGKTRLPGFSGEWETKRLGEVGRCLRGVSYEPAADLAPHDTATTVRLFRAHNVEGDALSTADLQFVEKRKVTDSQLMRRDDVLVCTASGSKDVVGKAAQFRIVDGYQYTFGAFMGCYRADRGKANPTFAFYLFQTGQYRAHLNVTLTGSSINNLRPTDIEAAEFRMPERSEQDAIAAVLSDMDAEIAALEARGDKTRAIKQGMMQQLLTGRVRLVEPEAAA